MTHLKYLLFLSVTLSSSSALAETPEIDEQGLVAKFENASSIAKTKAEAIDTANVPTSGISENAKSPSTPTPTLDTLLQQIETLKAKIVVSRSLDTSTQKVRTARHIGGRTVYNFKDGDIFEIRSGVDRVTDVQLESGEDLTSSPVAGDTVRWKIAALKTGEGRMSYTHVIIKPLDTDLETNLLITTNKRTYHLRLLASDWYMPAVSWNYPQDALPQELDSFPSSVQQEALNLSPEELHFAYKIRGNNYAWKPIRVFDDGKRTFFQMSKEFRTDEAPALFAIDEGEAILTNYRLKGDYYIVDRLINEAELRIGANKEVHICREEKCPSFLGRLF